MFRSIRTTAAAGLVAAALVASPAFVGSATATDIRYDNTVRVVDIAGSEKLEVRRHPFNISRVVARLPFNARGIKAYDHVRRRWTQISFVAADGTSVIGWVRSAYLADDDRRHPTIYQLVGVDAYERLPIFKRPSDGSLVIAEIPGETETVEGRGKCIDGYCLVRVKKGRRWVEGYIAQAHLAVKRYDDTDYDAYAYGKPSRDDSSGWQPGDDRPKGHVEHYPKKPRWLKEYRDVEDSPYQN